MDPPHAALVCAGCATTRVQPIAARGGRPRVPAGWRRLHAQLWCPACKRQRFVLRAVAVPIVGPADATWTELRAALHAAFGETTRCANWLVSQLYARDRQRQPDDRRLPKMPRVYLYPEARALFPALASQTLASLEQQVQAKYRAARLDVVWRHAASLPTYRYPTPLPLPARMWELALCGERWHLSARIGDRRWSLRLRQGPGMQRQIRVLQQVAAGTVEAGEATLYEVAAQRGDHRAESARDRRLMVKVAVWLARCDAAATDAPRDARVPRETLIVRTAADAFVTMQVAGREEVWRLNADHVRRWIAAAARRRQRLHEDLAHVARLQRHAQAHRIGADLACVERQLSDRLRRQLDAWTHQATAQIVAAAQRRGVAAIAWDDSPHGYVPSYPWHRFAEALTYKAAAAGIRVIASHPDPAGNFGGEKYVSRSGSVASSVTSATFGSRSRSATSRPKPEQRPARVPAGTAPGNAQKRRGLVERDPRAPGTITDACSSRDAAVEQATVEQRG